MQSETWYASLPVNVFEKSEEGLHDQRTKFSEIIQRLQDEFSARFNDFHSNPNGVLPLQCPLKEGTSDVGELEIDVTELMTNDLLNVPSHRHDWGTFLTVLPDTHIFN